MDAASFISWGLCVDHSSAKTAIVLLYNTNFGCRPIVSSWANELIHVFCIKKDPRVTSRGGAADRLEIIPLVLYINY